MVNELYFCGMQLFYSQEITDNQVTLTNDEFRHCIKVLRKKQGDIIAVTDGAGNLYTCILNSIAKHYCTATITETKSFSLNSHKLHVAFAPTKNADRTEWAIEKMVEIGVSKLSLLLCEHSERKVQKTERLKKIALSAMKQSLKYYLPHIEELTKFSDFIESIDNKEQNLFIGYCETEETAYLPKQNFTYNNTMVLIGPEGDFSPSEVETAKKVGFIPVSLGESRLRTETAAVVATTLMNSKLESK